MPRGKRSKDQTQVSISLPRALLEQINELAAGENRPRSNWIVTVLMRHVEQRRAQKKLEAGAPSPAGSTSAQSMNEDPPARVLVPLPTKAKK